MDTDAQGFGYLSLMIKLGGSLTTLAPWHPEISYLYSPGGLLLFATLSELFPQAGMNSIMIGAAHIVSLVFIGLGFPLGREIGQHSKRLTGSSDLAAQEPARRILDRWGLFGGVSAALSVGFWTALFDSHYTAVLGLTFSLACIVTVLRYARCGQTGDVLLSALFLAAAWIAHADSAFALSLGLVFLVASWPFALHKQPRSNIVTLALSVPGLALVLLTPWLISIHALIEAGIQSPFTAHASHWMVLLLHNGVVWPLLAIVGIWIHRKRRLWVMGMAVWLVAVTLLSVFDVSLALSNTPVGLLFRFAYPFSLAWHGPIVPLIALGSAAMVYLTRSVDLNAIERWVIRGSIAAGVVLLTGYVVQRPLLSFSKSLLNISGSFSTANDVTAMQWIRENTPRSARILNYPGDYHNELDWEAHWAPVITERDTVYFRWQPFFLIEGFAPGEKGPLAEEQLRLTAFWEDPTDESHRALLAEAAIDYVLVPEVLARPSIWPSVWRWRDPELLKNATSLPDEATYLERVYQTGGAKVLRFSP